MKFKRINYLTPIRVFRGHFFDFTLIYEMDLEGPTGVNISDFTFWTAKGLVEYQLTEAVDELQIRIRGRFNEVFSEGLALQITLPELSGMFRDSIVNETIQVECLRDVFWSGNPIRIPIQTLPTEPVELWVERKFASGNFTKIALLKVPNIRDEYGYYVELDQILQPYLERDTEDDFPEFIALENDELGMYRKSIRRFHLGGKESLSASVTAPNILTVISGKQDPETAFRTRNFWGKNEPFLSWRPDGFRQRMASGKRQKLPLSLLIENDITLTKTDSDAGDASQTININQGETVVDVVLSEKYSFALTHQADGTRILVSEAEGCYYRAIAFFPQIVASHLIVREVVDEDPVLMLVYNNTDTGNWEVLGFKAPITTALEIDFTHTVMKAFENADFQLTAAGPNYLTGCVLIFRLGDTLTHAAVQVPESNGTTIMETFFSSDNWTVNAVVGTDDGQFVLGSARTGVVKTDDNFASFTTVVATPYREYYQLIVASASRVLVMGYDNDGFTIHAIDPGAGTVIESHTPVPAVAFAGKRWMCLRAGHILVNATAATYYLLADSGLSLMDSTSTFAGDNFIPALISGLAAPVPAGIELYETYWKPRAAGFDILPAPLAGYVMQQVEALPDAQTFEFKIADLSEVQFVGDGAYYRQARQLYFRNQAGAYEFLLLPGDGATAHSSKKAMSSRYVDADSALEDGQEFVAWVNDSTRSLSTNSGYLSKKEYEYFLQELMLTKETYLVEGLDWVPVKLTLGKTDPVMDRPNLYQIEVNLEKSWSR